MLGNRPLLATLADSAYFSRTPAQHRLVQELKRGHNVLLIGDRGAGKTTTLRISQFDLRDEKAPVCYVSLAQAEDAGQAVVAVYRAAFDVGWIPEIDDGLASAALRGEDPFAPIPLVRALDAAPRNAVILVDDVNAPIGHALFGRLRDELWQLERTWGVAAQPDEVVGLIQPPADAFFEQRVELEPLTAEQREDLLRRRMERTDASSNERLAALVREGPGNPRELISLARQLEEEDGPSAPEDVMRGVEKRRQRAQAIAGRPAAMLVAEMEHLGPVSAGDKVLLERLGWTRPRAVDLLNRLEDGGVVVSYPERGEGPGRPRKVYELKPERQFLGGGQ